MKRILIVEDEPDQLVSMQLLLSMEGYEVATAENGAVALEQAAQQRPDLVVSDYMMPRMGGDELVRRLRGDERTRNIPVILCSAVDVRGPALWDSILRKPVAFTELAQVVRRLLERDGPAR
jgi:CheY-like chemotaxis protein